MRTNKKTLRNVILFSLVAISCGWIGVGVNQLLGEPSNLESLGSGIFIASPIVCMILLRLFGGDGWKDFPLKPRFKQNSRWYIFVIAVYPVVIGITMFVGKLLGWVDVSKFSVAAYFPVFATAFLPVFIKNILEGDGFSRLSHRKNGTTHQKRMADLCSGGIRLPNMAPPIQSHILRRCLSGNLFPL